MFWFPGFHPGIMALIATGFLAVSAGLFIVTGAQAADRRLALDVFRPGTLLATRLTETALAALLATGASLAVTAAVFSARHWALYTAASILIALSYALLGIIVGPLLGRVAGVFAAFLIPALDLGIAQDPMLLCNAALLGAFPARLRPHADARQRGPHQQPRPGQRTAHRLGVARGPAGLRRVCARHAMGASRGWRSSSPRRTN
jgi:hypothetical protein